MKFKIYLNYQSEHKSENEVEGFGEITSPKSWGRGRRTGTVH